VTKFCNQDTTFAGFAGWFGGQNVVAPPFLPPNKREWMQLGDVQKVATRFTKSPLADLAETLNAWKARLSA